MSAEPGPSGGAGEARGAREARGPRGPRGARGERARSEFLQFLRATTENKAQRMAKLMKILSVIDASKSEEALKQLNQRCVVSMKVLNLKQGLIDAAIQRPVERPCPKCKKRGYIPRDKRPKPKRFRPRSDLELPDGAETSQQDNLPEGVPCAVNSSDTPRITMEPSEAEADKSKDKQPQELISEVNSISSVTPAPPSSAPLKPVICKDSSSCNSSPPSQEASTMIRRNRVLSEALRDVARSIDDTEAELVNLHRRLMAIEKSENVDQNRLKLLAFLESSNILTLKATVVQSCVDRGIVKHLGENFYGSLLLHVRDIPRLKYYSKLRLTAIVNLMLQISQPNPDATKALHSVIGKTIHDKRQPASTNIPPSQNIALPHTNMATSATSQCSKTAPLSSQIGRSHHQSASDSLKPTLVRTAELQRPQHTPTSAPDSQNLKFQSSQPETGVVSQMKSGEHLLSQEDHRQHGQNQQQYAQHQLEASWQQVQSQQTQLSQAQQRYYYGHGMQPFQPATIPSQQQITPFQPQMQPSLQLNQMTPSQMQQGPQQSGQMTHSQQLYFNNSVQSLHLMANMNASTSLYARQMFQSAARIQEQQTQMCNPQIPQQQQNIPRHAVGMTAVQRQGTQVISQQSQMTSQVHQDARVLYTQQTWLPGQNQEGYSYARTTLSDNGHHAESTMNRSFGQLSRDPRSNLLQPGLCSPVARTASRDSGISTPDSIQDHDQNTWPRRA